ncbi:MAG: hypothetical protein FJ225_04415 [Lentisphaerae bacterium]|nr:hypothetical protein [Lentisphaerota bacterium]
MRIFARKDRKGAPRAPGVRDPFAVVPLRPEGLEIRHDSSGCAHLRARPELKGLMKRVAGLCGYDLSRKVQLDRFGTLFIGMADGTHSLHDIVERMVADSGRPRKEVEEGVVLFTKKLMTMNMIHLRIEN